MLTTESGWYISPVFGDGNIQGLLGCFWCPAISSSTASCGIEILRMEFSVFGRVISLLGISNFNPRAPCGARLWYAAGDRRRYPISIHAPLAGRDAAGTTRKELEQYFNPRAPCGARPSKTVNIYEDFYFNPRAPCGARLTFGSSTVWISRFQSTRPLRGATQNHCLKHLDVRISIHAPLAGRDGKSDEFSPADLRK